MKYIILIYASLLANMIIRLYQEAESKIEISLIKGFILGAQAQTIIAKDEDGNEDPSVQINIFQIGLGFIILTLTYLTEDE